ncbi:NAD-dependent deacylase [Bacillus songklensis]|uniref:NAD-dependent protein deacetylase n=1 Tax=Bacillus songklensis TaxID=1069116 RepID=A0ABV8B4L7_9BACI
MELQTLLRKAKYPVVLTGAGMSTESGLPDFRSAAQGLWKYKDPARLASTYAMEHNRDEFVEFYTERIKGLKQCQPHDGHYILAKWERKGLIKSIITQNVDGFHHLAGSENIAEVHGTLRYLYCDRCRQKANHNLYLQAHTTCECGGFLRPSVVLFGETLPDEAVLAAEQETKKADLFIVLGSSLQVSPANLFPIEAKRNGAQLVIINMEETELDGMADLVIHNRKIGEYLQEIDAYLSHE